MITHFFLKITQTTLTHTHCMFWGTELDMSCRLCVTVRQADSYMDVHVSRPRVFLLGRGSITCTVELYGNRLYRHVLWGDRMKHNLYCITSMQNIYCVIILCLFRNWANVVKTTPNREPRCLVTTAEDMGDQVKVGWISNPESRLTLQHVRSPFPPSPWLLFSSLDVYRMLT